MKLDTTFARVVAENTARSGIVANRAHATCGIRQRIEAYGASTVRHLVSGSSNTANPALDEVPAKISRPVDKINKKNSNIIPV